MTNHAPDGFFGDAPPGIVHAIIEDVAHAVWARKIRPDAFSAIMITAALMLPPMRSGNTEASTTRRPSMLCTRNSGSTIVLLSPATRAAGMMRGDSCLAKLVIRGHRRSRPDLPRHERGEARQARQFAEDPDASRELAPVGFNAEQALANLRMYRRTDGRKPDVAAALWSQEHDATGERVCEGLLERREIWGGTQRAGDEKELDVGNRLARAALDEASDAARQFGGKAGAAQ